MKLLIIRLSSMGDILHALPLAANGRLAGARVAWLTERRFAGLLETAPFVDQLFLESALRCGPDASARVRVARALALRRDLRAFAPDVTIDAQGLWKSAVVGRFAAAPVVGFAAASRREPASAILCHREVVPGHGARHVVDRNLALLEAAGIPVRVRAPDAGYLLEQPSAPAAACLEGLPRPFAMYHPGTARPEKAWGEENLAELARRLRRERGLAPVISWGPGDEARVQRFRAALPEAFAVPLLDFRGLARVIAASAFFVGGDTGPLHLADALGVRTMGLYGPTDPARNGPYRCPDCSLRYNPSTSVDAVAAKALQLLPQRP